MLLLWNNTKKETNCEYNVKYNFVIFCVSLTEKRIEKDNDM
jgi:hypothetical protein